LKYFNYLNKGPFATEMVWNPGAAPVAAMLRSGYESNPTLLIKTPEYIKRDKKISFCEEFVPR